MCDMAQMRFNALQCLFGISREAAYAAECVIKPLVFRSRNGYMLAWHVNMSHLF